MTQREMVIKHLKEYGEITSSKAWAMYGITRLSDIIFKLRGNGYNIDTIDTSGKNRFGKKSRYATYKLVK